MTKELLYRKSSKYYIFDVIMIALTLINVAGFLVDYNYYGLKWPIFGYALFAFLYLTLFILGRAFFKFELILALGLILLNGIELPVLFYLYGTNMLVYLLVGLVSIVVCIKKERKWIITAIILLIDIAVMCLSYIYPQTYIKDIVSSDDAIILRYKNIVANVSYFITVFILMIISEILLKRYEKLKHINLTLNENIKTLSKRDSLTRLFNKKFIDDYIKNLIADGRTFGASVYKISSFQTLEDKYGAQYNDVIVVGLAEVFLKEGVENAVIGRYSKSTFILIFSNADKMNEITDGIDAKIDGGSFSNIKVLRGHEVVKKDDTAEAFLQRLASSVKGYGDMCEDRDIL